MPDENSAVFSVVDEGRYRLVVDALGVTFSIDHLRRERHQLIGELAVTCDLPGARTNNGILTVGDMNLSSVRARQERAKYLAMRAQTGDGLDWAGLLEDLSQQVLAAERTGQPIVSLRDLPRPEPDASLTIDGLPLLARHPLIIFGDGGSAKSYLALHHAGRLAREGLRVGLFDWELSGADHRLRLEYLFGDDMPDVKYQRCDRPLCQMVSTLRRTVRDEQLDYVFFDSIAFACDGPPEAAEVASRYFGALRQLGDIGSTHIAHITKADGGDRKPFGSAFWHNGARSTWNVKLADSLPGSDRIRIGLFNRKMNLGPKLPAIGYEITFEPTRTLFRRVSVADTPDLSASLSVRQRMNYLLQQGDMGADEVAREIESNVETVKRTARRYKGDFVLLDGGNLALLERA